ncbi:MAG: Arc family DNA-binding protein [Firmicutes bacterium]|nr:Arc family DNA-binding protein [Bacillota bacterium]
MSVKSVSIRIEEEMLNKLGFVADYEGRSVNSHILVLIRESIKKKFEDENGKIDGKIKPAVNVKPTRKKP